MERWHLNPRIANVSRRFIGVVLIAEAFAIGQGAVDSRPEAFSHSGPSFTEIFTDNHGYAKESSFGKAYEFADGEALNLVAIVGLGGVGIQFLRGRRLGLRSRQGGEEESDQPGHLRIAARSFLDFISNRSS